LRWQAKADWQGGAKATPIRVNITSDAGKDATIAAKVETQGQWQMEPFAFAIVPDAPLSGTADVKLLLEMLNPWLRGGGHRLAGSAAGSIRLAGTLADPQPAGGIALKDVRYDHLGSGLCLQGVSGEIQATPQAVQLSNLMAKDTHGGTLSVQGGMQLVAPQRTNITISAKEAQLFCGGMVTGSIAGDLAATGELAGDLGVRGKIELGPLSVNLPEAGGASGIPQVKVLNDERAKAAAAAKKDGQKDSRILLDIDVDATPGRIFVRGHGLDAEFAGALKVKGVANKPDVVGTLRTKRGKFNLIDRQLELTEGILRFEGSIPPSPSMSITAISKAADATAKLVLEGSATNPKITLSSDPALPQDEVLARLLFGRDLQSISPYQAMQLARAAQQLAGKGGGGPDMLGKIRGALGLDTLSVDQDASGETTLGTGKYLADGVYVGVEQGRTPESRRIKTELEVIPNITVQTITGSTGETGGGVEWKYDY
jgi:translocation and assembly module TamB